MASRTIWSLSGQRITLPPMKFICSIPQFSSMASSGSLRTMQLMRDWSVSFAAYTIWGYRFSRLRFIDMDERKRAFALRLYSEHLEEAAGFYEQRLAALDD